MNWSIFKNLRNPTYAVLAAGIAFLIFDLNYYFMANLPGSVNETCMIGADLTLGNIIFAAVLSILVGVMFVGMMEIFQRKKGKLGAASLSGIGFISGTFTVFCTVCTLPVISLFGLSISLAPFTFYNWEIKTLSLAMMGIALFLQNRQLAGECVACKI